MSIAYAPKPDDYFQHARTEIAPHLPARIARVLEIGCGAGATLRWLRTRARCDMTVGIELVERAALAARAHVDRVEVGDAETGIDSVASDGPFDLVLCLDVLEHMVDPWRFIDRLADALPAGATVIARVPNVRYCRVALPLLFLGRWRYGSEGVLDRTHLRFFTRESLPQLFDDVLFEPISVHGSKPPVRSGSWWLDKLSVGFLADLFSVQYLIVVRRR